MFDFAAAGRAIIFFMAMVGQVIVGTYIAGYAANCFLVVLEDTAFGHDEVVWPDEPIVDWLWKVVYLVWLVAFWIVLAWLLVGVIGPTLMDWFPQLSFGLLMVATVWLIFPISLFSSLSGSSRWIIFRLEIFRRLSHHLPAMIMTYVMSGLLLAGWAWLAHYTMTENFALAPILATAGAAVILIYSRLLGRIAWLLNYRTPEKLRKKEPSQDMQSSTSDQRPAADPANALKKKKTGKKKTTKPRANPKSVSVVDPWAIPDEFEPPPGEKPGRRARETVEPYQLAEREIPPPAPPAAKPVWREDEESGPIGLQPLDEEPAPLGSQLVPHHLEHLTKVSEYEMELAGPPKELPPPKYPLWSGVYQFPWYPRTVRSWLWLSFGGVVEVGLFKLQMEFWPF